MKFETPEKALEDERGWIKNLVLSDGTAGGSIGGVELIHTLKGAVRANHWHRTDWHYLHVVSGRILYEEWPVGDYNMGRHVEARAGDTVLTVARTAHRVTALEDTMMVCVSHLPRDHETHEQDVVRL